jgi:hypothetical protein
MRSCLDLFSFAERTSEDHSPVVQKARGAGYSSVCLGFYTEYYFLVGAAMGTVLLVCGAVMLIVGRPPDAIHPDAGPSANRVDHTGGRQ